MDTRNDVADASSQLYRDARWPGIARLIYATISWPFWGFGLVHVLLHGTTPKAAAYSLVFLGLPLLACEWRAKKMGVILSPDALILVRALNRTHIPWSEIEGFETVPYGLWGEARLRVRRRGRFHSKVAIPTLVLTPARSWWTWWFQPARLCGPTGKIAEPAAFLETQLRLHSTAMTPA